MQLDPVEVADLLQVTRRVGAFQFDPGLMLYYYDTLGRLVHGQRITDREWEFLRRAVVAIPEQDPLCWEFIQRAVIDGRTRLAARQWLEQGRQPRGADVLGILRLIFAASRLARHQTASMEMPAQDLYSTYLRLEQQMGQTKLPVDLDTIWETLPQSAYLRALGCRVLPDVE